MQSFNEKMKVNRLNDYILLVLRTNDYTELTTCTHCNPVVINNYDGLNTTAIGMY